MEKIKSIFKGIKESSAVKLALKAVLVSAIVAGAAVLGFDIEQEQVDQFLTMLMAFGM